jgi:DNA-binding CsgD family transcriptional regulator
MKRTVLLFGVAGGATVALLNFVEYRWLVVEHSVEIYGGLVAVIFVALGLWLGRALTKPPERVIAERVVVEVPVPSPAAGPFAVNDAERERLGVTKRELEILTLIASGLSNREIAERIFVSENTVKTHSSRLFEKLGARRRTQAVQLGQQFGLLP